MDEEQRRIEVVVPDDQLSLAIGRRGQNVRLASQLTGWDIDILTEAEESERRTEEFRTRSQMFIDALDIDDVIAHLLVTEGFGSLEEVAYVAVEDLAEIEGFDVEVAAELQERARNALERRDREYEERYQQLGVEDDLATLEGLTPGMLVTFGENGIKTLDDFAGLAGDELVEMLAASEMGGAKLEIEDANALIMSARVKAHWFDDEEAAAPAGRRRSRHNGCRGAPGAICGRRGIGAAAPLHRHRRGARPRRAAAFCRRSRRRGRAGYRGAAAGTGFVVDAAPGYSGTGGGEAVFRASGAASGDGVAGTRRPPGGPAGAAVRATRWAWRAGPGLPSPGSTGSARRCGAAGRRCCCLRSMAPKPAAASWARWAATCRRQRVLTADELGAAFGRERIVHVAVSGGTLCRRLLLDLSRLAGFRAAATLEQATDFAPAGPAAENGGTEAHD